MRPFIGNPCGYGHCMRTDCEKCPAWKPCIYVGKNYKQINLPKWNWFITLLYRIEERLIKL
jgi:hypothetical protein